MRIDDREGAAVERDRHGVGGAWPPLIDGTRAALASIQSAVWPRIASRGVGDDLWREGARHEALSTRASLLMRSLDRRRSGRVAARTDEDEMRERYEDGHD